MAEVTWLGDADGSVESITQYGHTFIKGKPTNVPDNDPYLGKFKAMSVFAIGKKKAEVVATEDDEETKELKAELDNRNVKYAPDATKEALWKALQKDDDAKKAAQAAGQA